MAIVAACFYVKASIHKRGENKSGTKFSTGHTSLVCYTILMNTKTILIIIVVAAVVGGGGFYFGLQQGERSGYEKAKQEIEASYEELLEKATAPVVNPTENLPSANPFEDVNTNPFEGGYTNPFK